LYFVAANYLNGQHTIKTVQKDKRIRVAELEQFTVMFWAKPRASADSRYVLYSLLEESPSPLFQFFFLYGEPAFTCGPTTITLSSKDSRRQYPLEQFSHFAGVFNRTHCSLFLNGKLWASSTVPGFFLSAVRANYSDVEFLIGGGPQKNSRFAGYIQDMTLFHRAINSDQERVGNAPLHCYMSRAFSSQHINSSPLGLSLQGIILHIPFGDNLRDTTNNFALLHQDSSPYRIALGVGVEFLSDEVAQTASRFQGLRSQYPQEINESPPEVLKRARSQVRWSTSEMEIVRVKAQQRQRRAEYGVSAILTTFRRHHNLPFLVCHLQQHAFVKEFIIWNNDASRTLSLNTLYEFNFTDADTNIGSVLPLSRCEITKPVRIINSKDNIFTEAKFRACTLGRYPVCYIQDDAFLPTCLNGLYASYLKDPEVLHVTTDTDTQLINAKWMFFDPSIDMHTGFAWLGSGSFVKRSRASEFLSLLEKLLEDEQDLAELVFSLWMNEVPFTLAHPRITVALDQAKDISCIDCVENRERNEQVRMKALELLVVHLNDKRDTTFNKKFLSENFYLRPILASSKHDDCLLISNIRVHPDPQKVIFNCTTNY